MTRVRVAILAFFTLLAISTVGGAAAISPDATPQAPGGSNQAENSTPSIPTTQAGTVETQSTGDLPNKIFEQTYGTTTDDTANDLIKTEDGNFVIVGADTRTNGDFKAAIAKLTPTGEVVWDRTIESETNQSFYSGKQTSDGGFILAGYTRQDAQNAGLAAKLDSEGRKEWSRAFTYGQGGTFEGATETSDGEFLFAGSIETTDGDDDAEVVKTTADGTIKWNFSYSHRYSSASQSFYGIAAGESDTYYLAGEEYNNGNWDAMSMEINSVGEEQISDIYGHDQLDDWFSDVAVTPGDGPYYAGLRNGIWDERDNEYDFGDGWVYHDDLGSWSETKSQTDFNRFLRIDSSDRSVTAVGFTRTKDADYVEGYAASYSNEGVERWNLSTRSAYSSAFYGVSETSDGSYLSRVSKRTADSSENITFSKYTTQSKIEASLETTTIPADNTTEITLTATTSAGEPIAGATVSNAQLDVSTTTDQNGVATFTVNASSGSYTIAVSDPEYIDTESTLTVQNPTAETPVTLSNVDISPTSVTTQQSQHTVTFDAVNISADGQPDNFSVTIPQQVDLASVDSVETETSSIDPTVTTNGNTITFSVNPEEPDTTVDLNVSVDMTLSASE